MTSGSALVIRIPNFYSTSPASGAPVDYVRAGFAAEGVRAPVRHNTFCLAVDSCLGFEYEPCEGEVVSVDDTFQLLAFEQA